MTHKHLNVLSVLSVFLLVILVNFAYSAKTGPIATVENTQFQFGTIIEGQYIEHSFAIKNTGTAPLAILNVRTDWGCAAVDYPQQIPPGQEGRIKIKVDTDGYGGQTLHKRIMVQTNDTSHAMIQLILSGKVDRIVTIDPKIAKLFGRQQQQVKSEIKIVAEQKYAFEIVDVQAKSGKNIDFKLVKQNNSNRTEYVLTVENKLKSKGRYFDSISLKTDSDLLPEITIRVFGKIS